MRTSQIKATFFSVILILLSGYATGLYSVNELQDQPGKKGEYHAIRGERPSIMLEELPDNAWHPGKLRIRLQTGLAQSLPAHITTKSGENYAITGISSLDSLNRLFQARKYKNILHGYYATSARAIAYADRHRSWGFHTWFDVELDENTDIRKAIKQFSALDEVLIAEPLYRVELSFLQKIPDASKAVSGCREGKDENLWIPDDPLFSGHWSYHNTGLHGGTPGKDIDLLRAWYIEKGHPEVIVAVLDGGVEHWHPDLAANMWDGIGYNFVADSPTIEPDPNGHGTHVAGTVAAVSNNGLGVSGVAGGSGLNDGVRIMTCQVFDTDYSAGGFVQAFLFAADNGASITQNSWIFSVPGTYNQAILDAIDYFNEYGGGEALQGGITVFATGNANSGGHFYPAYYPGTLAVTATNNLDQRAGYSNHGEYVDVSAPGGEAILAHEGMILSTTANGTYGFKQGTSMACPHVSGAAALLASFAHRNQIELTPQQVHDLLVHNTDDHYFGFNINYLNRLGSGRLNAFKALKDLQDQQAGLYNPAAFTAQALGTNEIFLSWENVQNNDQVILFSSTEATDGLLEDGTNYQIGEMVENVGEVIYIGSSEEFTHSSLSSGTIYRYRLFSYNNELHYSTGRLAIEVTECETFSLPLGESFADGFVPPPCWTIMDLDGDGNNWRAALDPQDFIYVAKSGSQHGNTSLTPDNWLISPGIEATTGNIILSFSVRAQDMMNFNEKFSVLVSNTGNENAENFIEIFSATPSSDQWEEIVVNISGYFGEIIHVAFRHWDTEGIAALYLKDVSLEEGKPGDVNPDNDLNILDVVWMVKHLNGNTPEGFIYDAADLNGDGQIDEQDLQILITLVMEYAEMATGFND